MLNVLVEIVEIAESEDGEKDRLSIDIHESVNQLLLTSKVMKNSFKACCEGDTKSQVQRIAHRSLRSTTRGTHR